MEFKGTKGKWIGVDDIVTSEDQDVCTVHIYLEAYSDLENAEQEIIFSANRTLISYAPELLENAQMHVDALDLSDIEFYNKYGFNSAELMDRTRELIKRITE